MGTLSLLEQSKTTRTMNLSIFIVMVALSGAYANYQYYRDIRAEEKRGITSCKNLGDACRGVPKCCNDAQCYWPNGYSMRTKGHCVVCIEQGQTFRETPRAAVIWSAKKVALCMLTVFVTSENLTVRPVMRMITVLVITVRRSSCVSTVHVRTRISSIGNNKQVVNLLQVV